MVIPNHFLLHYRTRLILYVVSFYLRIADTKLHPLSVVLRGPLQETKERSRWKQQSPIAALDLDDELFLDSPCREQQHPTSQTDQHLPQSRPFHPTAMASLIRKIATAVDRLPEGIERAQATIEGRGGYAVSLYA